MRAPRDRYFIAPEIAGWIFVDVVAVRAWLHKRRNGRDAAATVRLTVALSPEFPLATVQKGTPRPTHEPCQRAAHPSKSLPVRIFEIALLTPLFAISSTSWNLSGAGRAGCPPGFQDDGARKKGHPK
jgi:hypothetical protein